MTAPPRPTDAISHLVEIPLGPIDDFLNGPQKLKRKVVYYFNNFDYLMSKIRNNNFKLRNEQISLEILRNKRFIVSFTVRSLVLRAIDPSVSSSWHPINIYFWYCFSYETLPIVLNSFEFSFIFSESVDIDLTLEKGALRYDRDEKKYYLINSVFKTNINKHLDTGSL